MPDLYSDEWQSMQIDKILPQLEARINSQFAGRGARFGVQEKLLADLRGKIIQEVALQAALGKAKIDQETTIYNRKIEDEKRANEEWTRRRNILRQETDMANALKMQEKQRKDMDTRIKGEDEKRAYETAIKKQLVQDAINNDYLPENYDSTNKSVDEMQTDFYREKRKKGKPFEEEMFGGNKGTFLDQFNKETSPSISSTGQSSSSGFRSTSPFSGSSQSSVTRGIGGYYSQQDNPGDTFDEVRFRGMNDIERNNYLKTLTPRSIANYDDWNRKQAMNRQQAWRPLSPGDNKEQNPNDTTNRNNLSDQELADNPLELKKEWWEVSTGKGLPPAKDPSVPSQYPEVSEEFTDIYGNPVDVKSEQPDTENNYEEIDPGEGIGRGARGFRQSPLYDREAKKGTDQEYGKTVYGGDLDNPTTRVIGDQKARVGTSFNDASYWDAFGFTRPPQTGFSSSVTRTPSFSSSLTNTGQGGFFKDEEEMKKYNRFRNPFLQKAA